MGFGKYSLTVIKDDSYLLCKKKYSLTSIQVFDLTNDGIFQ